MAAKTHKKDFQVRKAEIKDLPRVVELWKEFMAFHQELCSGLSRAAGMYRVRKSAEKEFAEYFLNATGDPNWCTLVGTYEGEVVAYIIAHIATRPPVLAERKFGFISDMMVSEEHRRRGLAKALVAKTLTWFKQKRIRTVELNVLLGNEPGMRFWTKLGFQTVLSRKMLRL
jgi:ribosomal protein S18 acetylase RimI-like enzyme